MSSDSSYTGSSTGADPVPNTGPIPGLSPDAPHQGRGGGRHHLSSIVLSLVLTPVGLALVAIGADRWVGGDLKASQADVIGEILPWLGGGAAVLLVVTLLGRVSGLGPLLAGVVWGAIPAAWLLLYPGSFFDFVDALPIKPSDPRSGLGTWGPAALTCVAGLLIGAGFTGRWKATPRA